MISGSLSKTNSNTTTGSLSYINDLVIQATLSGSYYVIVPNTFINNEMSTQLSLFYGYNITLRNNFLGTNYDYIIRWDKQSTSIVVPTPTPTPTETPTIDEGYLQAENLFFITDENGTYLDKEQI